MGEGKTLAGWFAAHARDLPWRREPRDPYRVLVSELMLQQTQVDRVIPRFNEFVRRFPTIGDLAMADEDQVLERWSGLGYYRRARSLHHLAQRVAAMGGAIPDTVEALSELPGIGPYTAAAIASLAFGQRAVTLDGNVRRVAARFLAFGRVPHGRDAEDAFTQWILGLMEEAAPGVINEALMELGARVCRPVNPECSRCPLEPRCRARRLQRPQDFPLPRAARKPVRERWLAACAFSADGRMLTRRAETGPILRGLWLPPWIMGDGPEGADDAVRARSLLPYDVRDLGTAPEIRHSVTYRRIRIVPFVYVLDGAEPPSEGWRLVDPEEPGVATSSLLAKLAGVCTPVWLQWKRKRETE